MKKYKACFPACIVDQKLGLMLQGHMVSYQMHGTYEKTLSTLSQPSLTDPSTLSAWVLLDLRVFLKTANQLKLASRGRKLLCPY